MLERSTHSYFVRAAIVQLCLPHYRVPFYTALSRLMRDELAIVAGHHSYGGSPRSVETTAEVKQIRVQNFFLMHRLAFQVLPRLVWSCPIVVLEFDLRILSSLVLFAVRRSRNLPVILWGHGLSRRSNSPKWVAQVRRWMAHQANAVVFYNNQGREDFIRFGLPKEKLFVANNSIDAERIWFLSLQHRVERRNVLFIGRLISGKKADLLVEGFARAYRKLPEGTRLIIIGDGPERDRLVSLVQVHQISELVDFTGEVTDDVKLAPFFAQSAVCVSPGYIGLSAIHSLAFGVPLLVADAEPHSPEIEALLPGQNCEYFTANDADALANRLVELLANPQRLALMGNNGRDLVQSKYSVQCMADVFLQAFEFVAH